VIPNVKRFVSPVWMGLTAAQAAWLARQHWRELPLERRQRLGELLRKSHANPARLTAAERDELRELARQLELRVLARRTAALVLLSRRMRKEAAKRD
jgi:hypothetical protein